VYSIRYTVRRQSHRPRLTTMALFCALLSTAALATAEAAPNLHTAIGRDEGLGRAHMPISCKPAVQAPFDRALALLHNFWYARALQGFEQVIAADPNCALAYWGAALTYNHPFWDAPTKADLSAAWDLVQKGRVAQEQSPRERLYLAAVTALYKEAGAAPKPERDEAYSEAMGKAYAQFPDDETKLFYGLSLLGTVKEGTKGFDRQGQAARLFEAVAAHQPRHPGVLHYLIHVYDDPSHAPSGLQAARHYAKAAAAVPHAQHMPSHIFTRLGYWAESADTNERAWRTSEADVKRAGESGANRDFHSLNYLQYAYLQLGRYRDAKRVLDIIGAQYEDLPNKTTAADTPELQSRHVRGRTIYALPDRVVYGYFDMLTRYIVEAGDWEAADQLPLPVPSRDFVAAKLYVETLSAAQHKDPIRAQASAEQLVTLSQAAGQHPFAQKIISLQAKEAEAVAATAAGDTEKARAKMDEALAIEDAIDALSQPPYPIIPAHELFGTLLMQMNRPAEAATHFLATLKRTPGRPKALFGLAQATEASGDKATARKRYQDFLISWKHADPDRPEVISAKHFVARHHHADREKSEAVLHTARAPHR
jgi:tetratricopeptide (TPR) repeat protein